MRAYLGMTRVRAGLAGLHRVQFTRAPSTLHWSPLGVLVVTCAHEYLYLDMEISARDITIYGPTPHWRQYHSQNSSGLITDTCVVARCVFQFRKPTCSAKLRNNGSERMSKLGNTSARTNT